MAGLPRPITCSSARLTREAGKEKSHLDAQRFTMKSSIIKQPHRAAIAELVMHKVHRPALIGLVGNRQRLLASPNQPFPGFYPQIELQRPIDPGIPFVISAKALDVAQVQKHTKPRVALAGRDT